MPQSVVGLDISSRGLLATEIEDPAGKHPKLVRIHAVPLEPGTARDSEVIDITAVSLAVKRLWNEAKFRSKRVVLGVGNQRVLVRDHTVGLMPLPQVRQALPYQVEDLLPVPVSETILDFYPIEEVERADETSEPTMRGLLVAAIKEGIETSVATLDDAGLSVIGVDLSPFAIVRAINAAGAPPGTHTVVMVCARTTYIIVLKNGVPQFVRIVPAGGENITDAAQEAMGSDRDAAEILKYQIGIDQGADPRYQGPAQAMLDALKGIFGSIRSTNSYYLSNYPGSEVSSLILFGAETRLPGFARAASEHIGLPVTLGKSLAGVTLGRGIAPEALTLLEPDLVIPVGLALGNR